DLADESSVCSTPLLLLKKLDGVELSSGLKTVKSILKSKSMFKAKTLKVEDDPPLAMVMKELNELKLQINKKKSSYSRNKNTQQCKRTNHRTCDHAEFMSSIHTNQHHTGQGESSSRSRPLRPSVSFPSCIHCGYNNHHSDDCLYYPTCEIYGSYDHNTHDFNWIISQRRVETDIQEKDKKKAKHAKTKHGMEKTRSNQVQSQSKSKKSTGKSTPSKSKDSQVEKIQLEGLTLPNLKLYYKNKKTRAENANWVQYNFKGQFCQAPKVVL
ncbi:hypothetical protein Tco_0928004, partial [Tanacetum coccineum]